MERGGSLSQDSFCASQREEQGRWPWEGAQTPNTHHPQTPLQEVARYLRGPQHLQNSVLFSQQGSSASLRAGAPQHGAHPGNSDLEPKKKTVAFENNTLGRQEAPLRASPYPSITQHRSLPPPTPTLVGYSLNINALVTVTSYKKGGGTKRSYFFLFSPRGSFRGAACFTLKPAPQKIQDGLLTAVVKCSRVAFWSSPRNHVHSCSPSPKVDRKPALKGAEITRIIVLRCRAGRSDPESKHRGHVVAGLPRRVCAELQ